MILLAVLCLQVFAYLLISVIFAFRSDSIKNKQIKHDLDSALNDRFYI